MQQTAKAVASHQTPSLRLPPLIPAFKSKLAVLFMNDAVIWPLPAPDLQSAKTLREFPAGDEGVELGNMMQQIQNELKLCLPFGKRTARVHGDACVWSAVGAN